MEKLSVKKIERENIGRFTIWNVIGALISFAYLYSYKTPSFLMDAELISMLHNGFIAQMVIFMITAIVEAFFINYQFEKLEGAWSKNEYGYVEIPISEITHYTSSIHGYLIVTNRGAFPFSMFEILRMPNIFELERIDSRIKFIEPTMKMSLMNILVGIGVLISSFGVLIYILYQNF